MSILTAFLIVGGIALVLGVLLALISYFFAVPEDPTKAKIRACLPGVNCGACGYTGCDDYAAALAEGGVKPSLCVPGAQAVADEIAAILGVESEAFEDVVAYVACNGHCGVTQNKADYEGVQTCAAATMLYGGPGACTHGCLGYGDCAAACPVGAICTIDGIAHVDTSRCIGCGVCVKTCPKGVIRMLPQKAQVTVQCNNKDKGADARKACQNACIGCKKCEKVCPNGAITVTDNLAFIDYAKCTGCGVCLDNCPAGCIKHTYFPNLPEGVTAEDLMN